MEIVFLGFRGFFREKAWGNIRGVSTIAFDFIGPLSRVVHARSAHVFAHVGTHAHTVPSLFPYVLRTFVFTRDTYHVTRHSLQMVSVQCT